MTTALEEGRGVLSDLNPEMEAILRECYDDILPEFSESLVEMGLWAPLRTRRGRYEDPPTLHNCCINSDGRPDNPAIKSKYRTYVNGRGL